MTREGGREHDKGESESMTREGKNRSRTGRRGDREGK